MEVTRIRCREIDEEEGLNWVGSERKFVARYQFHFKSSKYSTHDIIQVREDCCETLDQCQLPEELNSDSYTVIGGNEKMGGHCEHSLLSWNETFPLNSSRRNFSKQRYNLDFNRSLIGKLHTVYYFKDCRWMAQGGLFCHTAVVSRFLGTNNYEVFDCNTQLMVMCKNMTGTKTLAPGDVAVIDEFGDIRERISYRHTGLAHNYDWRHDMERVFRGWDMTNYEKGMKLFSWCYEIIASNRKLFSGLRDSSVSEVQNMSAKCQLKRAKLGLQLLLCEVNATALLETVCPAPRPLDIFFRGTVFGRELATRSTAAQTTTDSKRSSMPDSGANCDSLVLLSKALWLDMMCETSLRSIPRDALELIYSYGVMRPLSFAFKELLFQNNTRYGSHVKRLRDIGSLKGRPYLIEFCNVYASSWCRRQTYIPTSSGSCSDVVTNGVAVKSVKKKQRQKCRSSDKQCVKASRSLVTEPGDDSSDAVTVLALQ